VVAHYDFIQGNLMQEFPIDGLHHLPALGAPGHIRLIGYDYQEKSGSAQGEASLRHPRQNF
jgi:hypothetical protein